MTAEDKDNKSTNQGISGKYALCLVDVNNLGTRTFSYLIPDSMREEIKIGQAVLVPFGNRKQNIIAFVTAIAGKKCNFVEIELKF